MQRERLEPELPTPLAGGPRALLYKRKFGEVGRVSQRLTARQQAGRTYRNHALLKQRRLLTALTVPMLLLPSLGARLAQAMPARWYFGGGLAVIGIGGLGLAKVSLDLSSPEAFWAVGAMLLLGGAGCALLNAQITAAAVSSLPADRAATAAAMCVTMRQVGFAIGIALIGAVLQLDAGKSYPSAYALVGVITLVLAALVFAMLAGPNPHEQR